MCQTFLERFSITCDTVSFIFILFNFAIVGTVSIFYGKGIPTMVTQGYLILTSVILAWQLSHFDEWTAWSLLVMLALYDLCAVLTPCGPLKALVNLMSKEGAPDMPGLLYEANLPTGVSRSSRERSNVTKNDTNNSDDQKKMNTESRDRVKNNRSYNQHLDPTAAEQKEEESRHVSNFPLALPSQNDSIILEQPLPNEINVDRIGLVPLAIARIYKLRILAPEEYKFLPRLNPDSSRNSTSYPDPPREFCSEELVNLVTVQYPESGGRILVQTEDEAGNMRRRKSKKKKETRYIVLDRKGELKRVLRVDVKGKVFEEVTNDREDDSNSNIGNRSSIKLGLVCVTDSFVQV